jgi:capsular exopolysaccharide synthesis family protein
MNAPLPKANPGEASTFSLDLVIRLLLKHAFWVLIFSIAGPAIAAAWVNRQEKIYEATATIVYDFSQPATLGRHVDVFDPYSDYFNKQELMETEFRILTSSRVARQVVVDAGLDVDRAFLASTFPGVPPEKVRPDDIAAIIRVNTKVESVRGTHLAKISYEDSDPARSQRLVAAVIDAYIRISNEDSVGTTGTALEWLQGQVIKLQHELEGSERDLYDFKNKRNLLSVNMKDQNNMLRDEIQSVHSAVTQANIRRAQLVSRANALAKVTRANPDDLPASELLNDPVLSQLRTVYTGARSELASLRLGLSSKGDNHPDVKIAQAKLDQALDAFVHQVRNLQSSALREAAVVSAESSALKALLDNARTRALDLNLQEIDYNRLSRAATTNEKLYTNVLERMKEVDISRMINVKNIKMLDAPQLPVVPIRPKVANTVAIGVGVGFLIGLLIAVLRELADRTIKTPADIEQKLGLTSLGLLPQSLGLTTSGPKRVRGVMVKEAAPELFVSHFPMSTMAEAARSIRSNIMFMSPDHPPKLILVTSAGVGEGKTTTSVSLATTFGQAGARTLLVDLDLRRPRIHRIFKTGNEHGVTSVLLGEDTLDEAIQKTEVENVSVLPAGRIPPNPAELLMSEKLLDLLEQLRGRFDRIIIDSPPVNPITDAVILGTRVDGTVFVVRSFKATTDQVRHATRALADVNAKILGVILNAVDLGRLEYKYSYYYRSYATYAEDKASSPPVKPRAA